MKLLLIPALAVSLAASAAGVQAKSMTMTAAQVKAQINSLQGSWTCKGDGPTHTATFTSMYGGKAMRIEEGQSLETVVFDMKRQMWIDQHIGADGMYGTMEGAPVQDGIDFRLVYPQAQGTGRIRMKSKNVQTNVFTMMQNGKMVTMRETCTKNG